MWQGTVVKAFNPSTWEVEAGCDYEASLHYTELQTSHGYIVKHCLKKQNKNCCVSKIVLDSESE